MIRVMFNTVSLGFVVCGLLLTGCAGLQGWQGPTMVTEGDSSQGYSPQATDLSDADGIRAAVEEAQQFLEEQDEKVRALLEMRADLEEKIHTIQETEIGRLNAETEVLQTRVDSVELAARQSRDDIDAQWAPVQALAEAQAGELTHLKESMIAIVEETHHDRQLLHNNLKNYRDALVAFHALMVKLETLVLDEEFRAKEVETGLSKTLKDQVLTLTRLESTSIAIGHLQKRTTQLHRYVNEVQKNLHRAIATWQADAPGRDGVAHIGGGDAQERFSTPLLLPIEDLPTRTRPALVPEMSHVIQPFEGSTTRIAKEKAPVTSSLDAEGGTTSQ